jgi:hypothetical protein
MAGAVDKKIIEIKEELDSSPDSHLSSRTGILDSVTLIRGFSETYLNALCEKFTSGSGNYTLSEICENLARQRLICWGARSLQTTFRKFDLPASETVNGALGLTEPNTSFMGIKATDIGETFTVNLTSLAGTQTQGNNTFSTDVRDYYLVRSRVTGELIDINDDITPYSTPDSDTVFGNAIAWGEDVGSEAGTWNADYAKANIASVALQSEGLYNELNILTLQDHLTQGSNSSYTTLGPGFGQKFYLKRHTNYVNTFTIIGTTTVNSLEVTGISDTDIAKIKYGDVISGTGIPEDNVTIAGVKSADSKIRLSNTGIATADGTVTLTVNSVPFGYAENDIFCQVEIVGEGLVTNSDWKPVGDDAGDYSGSDAGADDLLNANTSQFVGLLGFFDPDNGSANATNDLTKGSRSDWISSGKEIDDTTYPYIETNPIFPAMGSTRKAYETEGTGPSLTIIGTQPTGLGENDIPAGRYVRMDLKRSDSTGPLDEFRYITDSAEKFYYAPQANGAIAQIGTDAGTAVASLTLPRTTEPRATLPRTGLTKVVTKIRANERLAVVGSGGTRGSTNAITNWTVPQDDIIHADGSSGIGQNSPTVTSYYYRVNNGIIEKRSYVTSYTNSNSTYETVSNGNGPTIDYPIVSNYVARKLTTNGTTANTDVAFIASVMDELQGTAAITISCVKNSTTTVTTADTAGLVIGMLVAGTGIPYRTTVASITNSTTFVLSVAATDSLTSTLTFTSAGGAKFRDPVMEEASTKHVTSASANDANFDTYVSATAGGLGVWDTALSTVETSLAAFYIAAGMDSRRTRLEVAVELVNRGTSINCASFGSSDNVHAKWVSFSTACGTLVTTLNARIAEIDARIGKPTYAYSTGATVRVSALTIEASGNGYTAGTLTGTGGGHDGSSAEFAGSYTVNSEGGINGVTITAGGTSYTSAPTIVISDAGDGDAVITAEIDGSAAVNEPSRVYVSTIPSSNTTGGQVPYGRSIYNNINLLLGKDIDLMGKIIKEIGSLSSLVDLVKTARNKYEIFSGRDKEYS